MWRAPGLVNVDARARARSRVCVPAYAPTLLLRFPIERDLGEQRIRDAEGIDERDGVGP